MNSLAVGDLCFDLQRSARRRSVQITVDRGGELRISAPESCPTTEIERFVREKRFWIYMKLAEKEALEPAQPERRYVSGEGFPYLGRSYRLLLVDHQDVPVKLEAGRFRMDRRAAVDGRAHVVRWYTEHAEPWLAARVERFRRRVGVRPAAVNVRDLGYRWGSCGKGDRLYFHWRAILLPPSVVDYVVVHELVHLIEPHHRAAFWTRLERVMPDFATRREWLAGRGRQIIGT